MEDLQAQIENALLVALARKGWFVTLHRNYDDTWSMLCLPYNTIHEVSGTQLHIITLRDGRVTLEQHGRRDLGWDLGDPALTDQLLYEFD